MFTGALVALVVLPALSAIDADTVCPAPSVERTALLGALLVRPDRASSATQASVTSVLYQPSASGLVVGAALRLGAVSSTLMPLTVAVGLLPAWSVAVRVT